LQHLTPEAKDESFDENAPLKGNLKGDLVDITKKITEEYLQNLEKGIIQYFSVM